MNARLLLYGIVALVLFVLLSEDSGTARKSPLILTEKNRAYYQTECLKEIVGFEYPSSAKIRYCECVVKAFADRLEKDPLLREAWTMAIASYHTHAKTPRKVQAALAINPDMHFSSGYERLDVLLKLEQITIKFAEMESVWKDLVQKLDVHWKQSMVGCTEQAAISKTKPS